MDLVVAVRTLVLLHRMDCYIRDDHWNNEFLCPVNENVIWIWNVDILCHDPFHVLCPYNLCHSFFRNHDDNYLFHIFHRRLIHTTRGHRSYHDHDQIVQNDLYPVSEGLRFEFQSALHQALATASGPMLCYNPPSRSTQ